MTSLCSPRFLFSSCSDKTFRIMRTWLAKVTNTFSEHARISPRDRYRSRIWALLHLARPWPASHQGLAFPAMPSRVWSAEEAEWVVRWGSWVDAVGGPLPTQSPCP